MADSSLVDLRKRLDLETAHKAFLEDFAGWPKPEQSRLIRLVAGDDGILPFLDLFADDLMMGPTNAENERMVFLGNLCGKLAFEGALETLVDYIGEELKNMGEMGAGEFPEMLPLAVAIADLNSPLEDVTMPIGFSNLKGQIVPKEIGLADAIERLDGPIRFVV